jgi:hypothetical protein
MSTKTLRKRIALVAVSALGAGLLSVVAVPSANAAPADLTIRANASTNTAAVLGTSSQGLIGTSGTDYSATSGLTMVATLASSGTLALSMAAAQANTHTIKATLSGATASSVSGSGSVLSLSATEVTGTHSAAVEMLVKPNSGVTSFTVTTVETVISTGVSSTKAKLTVTVSSAATIGVASPADSYLKASDASCSGALDTSVDVATTFVDEATGYVCVDVYDANVQSVATGVLSATATGNVKVGWSAPTALSSNTAVTTGYRGELQIIQSVDNAPTSSVVTISYNGIVIGTKSIKFTGDAAAINVASVKNGKTGDANSAAVLYYFTVTDSAGNQLVPVRTVSGTYVNDDGIVGAVTIGNQSTATTPGYGTYACGSDKYGKSAAKIQMYNNQMVKISKTFDVACYGDIVTYTASLDKATYNTGDIATLTISVKDIKGNVANDVDDLGTDATAANQPTVDLGGMTLIGGNADSHPTYSDSATAGVKTYKVRVGTTAGAYTGVVSLPQFNASASAPTQTSVTLQYKIVSSDSGVTNADVLKAIVSLIASINKQIAALQKALLKK